MILFCLISRLLNNFEKFNETKNKQIIFYYNLKIILKSPTIYLISSHDSKKI